MTPESTADIDLCEDEAFLKAQELFKITASESESRFGICADVMLFKAVTEKDFTEFFLKYVFDNNKDYFNRWYKKVKEGLQNYLKRKKIFPLTDEEVNRLEDFFSVYKDAFQWNAMGWQLNPSKLRAIREAGLLDKEVIRFPEISFRLAMVSDVFENFKEQYGVPIPEKLRRELSKRLVKESTRVEMTKIDRAAIEYAKRRANGFLQPLVNRVTDDFVRDLRTEEMEINSWVMRGLRSRANPYVIGRELGNAMRTQGYNRDYERVMRTEMGEAYGLGMWRYQVESVAEHGTGYTAELRKFMGIEKDDILVYKLAWKKSCEHCRTIWAHEDGTPRLYTERFLRAQPSNYGKKTEDWKPQLGLIHVNCSGEGGIKVARYGIDNLTYPKLFDSKPQDFMW